jgi:Putative lumazine-binding
MERSFAETAAEVQSVMQDYFDGLHFSDTARLKRAFHPLAQYVCVTDGTLLHRTMDEYFPVVDARPSPASKGEARRDEVLELALAGPVTATLRARCAIGGKLFTDCLTLIRLDGRWQIISKVFHYEAVPA